MSYTEDLSGLLRRLRLSGITQTLDLRIQQAVDDSLGHTEFLFRLLSDEAERRDQNQLDGRVKRARFESHKGLDDFDFAFNPKVPKSKTIDLATCAFVERKENALLIGNPGVGKSHLAQAIGNRACRAGFSVLYAGAQDLLKQLRAARADGSLEKRLARLVAPNLLIVDDFGLRPWTGDEPHDLYEIIRRRYERGSTLLTSNRDESEIAELFADPVLASAAMDRLLHRAHVLVLEGDSYRNPPASRRVASRTNPSPKETSR